MDEKFFWSVVAERRASRHSPCSAAPLCGAAAQRRAGAGLHQGGTTR